jgi:hypothetical protein
LTASPKAAEGINDIVPNPVIVPKPGKVAGMIWIVKHFQTLLMSAKIAGIFYYG